MFGEREARRRDKPTCQRIIVYAANMRDILESNIEERKSCNNEV